MKRILLVIAACALTTGIVMVVAALVEVEAPSMIEGDFEHDRGVVRFDGKETNIEHTFELINRTNNVIEIGEISRSCGCLSVSCPDRTWEPDETLKITLSMILRGFRPKGADATFMLSDGRMMRVYLQATSCPAATITYANGSLIFDEAGAARIAFRYLSLDQVDEPAVPEIETDPAAEVRFLGWTRETEARLEDGAPARYRGEIEVTATDDVRRVEMTVRVGEAELVRVFYR